MSGYNVIFESSLTCCLLYPFPQHFGRMSLGEYGAQVSVRGLMYSNTSVAKQGGMRTFGKPEGYAKIRDAAGAQTRKEL